MVAVGVAALLCLVLVVLVVRGVSGCVSRAFSSKDTMVAAEHSDESVDSAAEAVAAGPVDIELVMIGDVLQHSGVFTSGYRADGTRNYDHVFAHITSQLEGADIKVVNQETVLGGTAFEFSGYPSFNGPQEMGDAEAAVGFNVVLRATNHALDMGYQGLSNELSFWRNQHPEVKVIGAHDPTGGTPDDDWCIFEKDGFTVALLNFTYDLNGYEDPQGAVSLLTEEHVRQTVSAADAAADLVVVFPHWGEEYNLEPVQEQYDMAKVMMDAGADAIIGGHPHVIEPVEVLTASDGRRVPCFWSVGNFISTQIENQNLIGGVARLSLRKEADGSCGVVGGAFVPTVTHKGLGTDMTTYLLTEYNDGLAATNYLASNGTDNTSLTVAWAHAFCSEVLGAGYDASAGRLVLGPESLARQVEQSQLSVVSGGAGTAEGDAPADTELDEAA